MELEEYLPDGIDASPLFSGPLPFGSYFHDKVGNMTIRTREHSKNDMLFADDIWPGSILMANALADSPSLCKDKCVLELGAGAALPSLVSAKLCPKRVVISDYPDPTILQSISASVLENGIADGTVTVVGHQWGDSVAPLLDLLQPTPLSSTPRITARYDLILLSELLWKDTYALHKALLQSVTNCLRTDGSGVVLVSLAHRPSPDGHKPEHDMEFFEMAMCPEFNFAVELLQTDSTMQDSLSGSEQCGDDIMCVYLYALRRQSVNGLTSHAVS